jgi:hypothetical protein
LLTPGLVRKEITHPRRERVRERTVAARAERRAGRLWIGWRRRGNGHGDGAGERVSLPPEGGPCRRNSEKVRGK